MSTSQLVGMPQTEPMRTVRELLHEIRNSISVVLAHAHLLASRPWIGSGVEAIRTICQEAHRIAALLSLLPSDFAESAVEAGPPPEGVPVTKAQLP
jgi:nitrogen-specific signal transduction histidine kinase